MLEEEYQEPFFVEGFEIEQDEEGEFEITNPFDPKQVDITVEPATIRELTDRIEFGEIDLFPDFQRNGNLWNNAKMSQLIESILIKLPIPAFYVDVADNNNWIVVDGLQRLSTLDKFIVKNNLKLTKLDFLKDLEGKRYEDLGRVLQRNILSTQVTLFKIRKGTPKKVLINLFHRINTGGTKMTSQEIRHALNQGPGSSYLLEVSTKDWFQSHMRVSPKRMLDRELFLRFIAFYRNIDHYSPPLSDFLDNEMEYLNTKSSSLERENYVNSFRQSLLLSKELFGNKMFSKALVDENKRVLMNRSLFETTTVNLAKLSSEEGLELLRNKVAFLAEYKKNLQDSTFDASITANTSIIDFVKFRHNSIRKIISKYSNHDYQPIH